MLKIPDTEITKELFEKIATKEMKIGIMGLGYVGLPLAMEFAEKGYSVIGIDIDAAKVDDLNEGKSHIIDVPPETVSKAINNYTFKATADFSIISELDAISICVPTPLNKNQEPDTSYMEYAVNELLKHIKQPLLVVLESTTYPGTTRELFAKRFQAAGKKLDKDYFLCFSPERVDPGNLVYQTKQIPKVVGGITTASSAIAKKLYSTVLDKVVVVSSPETAEMSKLIENTFRSVNIAFMNEMALMCERMGLNIWEAIDAAATKPFGFMPFYPGPGVGGHCIPLDPMYLHWKGKQNKFFNRFIEMSQEINMNMPYKVVDKVQEAVNHAGKSLKNAKILLVGASYKANINDVRESPTLEVYRILQEKEVIVSVQDPFVPSFVDSYNQSISVIQAVEIDYSAYDCVVVLTKHNNIDYDLVLKDSELIVDMRYVWKNKSSKKIFTIGGEVRGGEIL